MLKYLADPLRELPDIVFWLMGGLWSITWRDLLYILPVVVAVGGVVGWVGLSVDAHRLLCVLFCSVETESGDPLRATTKPAR